MSQKLETDKQKSLNEILSRVSEIAVLQEQERAVTSGGAGGGAGRCAGWQGRGAGGKAGVHDRGEGECGGEEGPPETARVLRKGGAKIGKPFGCHGFDAFCASERKGPASGWQALIPPPVTETDFPRRNRGASYA